MTQDIVIYPGDDTPRIDFTGSSVGASSISLKVLGDSTLSFEGTEGQLFSITDNLTEGVIFSVNDGGGLPIIEANADGNVSLVRLGENLGVGTDSPIEKLHVVGNALITSGLSALNLSADTISVPVITNLQSSATDHESRLDVAETTISQIEDDINTLETSATDHESRIATLESAPGGTSDHGALTGLSDDDHTQYVLATGARSMNSLSVTGNIAVTGTVDGRDIAADGTKLDNHVASSTVHFTVGSIDHGSIAGLGDNDHPQYVLSTTNTTLSSTVSTHIADSTIHFTKASIDHGGIAGLGDDDHTQYVLATGARSMNSLSVTGNIAVTGTVDGRDIAADGTKLDNHVASSTVHFTVGSIDHGSIAGLGDNDHPQYVLATTNTTLSSTVSNHIADSTIHFTKASIDHGGIAGLGDDDHTQYVLATGARSMNSLSVTGNISVTGTVDGRDIAADGTAQDSHIADTTIHFTKASIDHGGIAGLGDDDHTQYVLATGARSMNSLSVTGNISVTGTVDGRDIAADGTKLDNHVASGSVHFTEASIDHGSIAGLGDNDHPQYVLSSTNNTLSSTVSTHIADSTIHFTKASIDHGGIAGLGDDDHTQYVLATGARSMNSLSVTGNISVTGTVDGRDIAADGTAQDNHIADTTIHFTKASIDHGGIAGLGDDDHTQYVLATGARSMNSLSVTGNISVTGTVDGRDIAADGTKLDNHVASGSVHFTEASIDHGSIAGLGDDDHTQYLRTDGTRALTGNMSAGSNRITNVADPVDPQDVATAYWGLTSFPLLAQNLLDLPNHATARDNLGLSAMATEADDPNDGNTYGRKNNAWAQIDHGALTGLGDDDHTQYALIDGTRDFSSDLGVAGELSANSLNVANVSATWDKLRLDVVWDHLLPHDQNGNWNANTANGGAAYQQNQGAGGTWIYDPSVNPQAPTIQGVMVASNNNTTATNAGATKYHVNLSTYLSIDTVYYFRVATGHSTDCCIRFGVVNEALGATATPQRGAYVQFDTDVDGNIHFVTADDNVRTDTDTGLAATSIFVQEFAWFAIKVEDGGGGSRAVGLYNVEDGGTLLAKHTTNIPDAGSDSAMRAFIQCIGRGSTYRACYLDTFGVYMPGWCPPSWVH